ncbi:MAG TPA: hypothetical protein VK150_06970 [Geothrix sp.]|nr:hypothetical protein [Geothrix sp.]
MTVLPPYMHEYSGWKIHGKWDDRKKGWDCLAIKGDLEMASEDMNWHQFISALDRVDGKSKLQDYLESTDPARIWAWMPPPGQGIPRRRSDGLPVVKQRPNTVVPEIHMPPPPRVLATTASPLFDLEGL